MSLGSFTGSRHHSSRKVIDGWRWKVGVCVLGRGGERGCVCVCVCVSRRQGGRGGRERERLFEYCVYTYSCLCK